MADRAIGQQHQLLPPLAECEKQRAEQRQQQQPVADRHVDRDGPRRRPQDESDRDRQHVEDHDVLEPAEYSASSTTYDGGDGAKRHAQRERGAERHDRDHRRPPRARPAQAPRPRRSAVALDRMQPIGFAIRDVVDEVNDAGEHAEHDERRDRPPDGVWVEEPLTEDQSGEDDEVLRPLRRA